MTSSGTNGFDLNLKTRLRVFDHEAELMELRKVSPSSLIRV
jgi:hypothetical protein